MKKQPIICIGGRAPAFAVLDGDPLCVDCLYKAVTKSDNPNLIDRITPLFQSEEESDPTPGNEATG